ncbi:lysine N(6)-hydroxylase/L-ornithine N(5)-oxygenase family protein [Halostreptopolyspora alba]|uniref:L-lysine N6-monooxygenase MbtG n=1 Tax=Halostreptopolyspora alba TaxID=2487137 RepID=A0A3N0EIA6_9ACTN|nr:L-lysine 6-monooxygenase [Nocardiopsaceae bacterium YIM 96095]
MHYHCVGVGAGPANLSLASLLHEHSEISNIFLDRKNQFSWHDDQQIDGAALQVSPLKDLVTLSNPTNKFSFLSYLHEQGRIYHFLNAQFSAVPRKEFRNYLKWASSQNENVVFGEDVRSVHFERDRFVIATSHRRISADNLVVGVGSEPRVPSVAQLGRTQFHVNEFVSRSSDLANKRVAVVGGGQSGAEAVLDLISRPERDLPRKVQWISRRANFLPIDDSPFTNDYFTPSYSDYFYALDQRLRESINNENVLASDGISLATLQDIYQRAYVHRFVEGSTDFLELHPNRTVTAVKGEDGFPWRLSLVDNNCPTPETSIQTDVVIWATGFRTAETSFLDPIAHRFEREGDEFRIDEDFAVNWDGPPDRNVFLQNAARKQRGVADPNLSLVAWRSQQILDRIRGARSTRQLASFITWQLQIEPDHLLEHPR